MNLDEDCITVDDSTSRAIIENCSKMPNIWKDLKKGNPVFIILIRNLVKSISFKVII